MDGGRSWVDGIVFSVGVATGEEREGGYTFPTGSREVVVHYG